MARKYAASRTVKVRLRDLEIMEMLTEGYTVRAVASTFGVSAGTVHSAKERVQRIGPDDTVQPIQRHVEQPASVQRKALAEQARVRQAAIDANAALDRRYEGLTNGA